MGGQTTVSQASGSSGSSGTSTKSDDDAESEEASVQSDGQAKWETAADESGVDPVYEAIGLINEIRQEAGLAAIGQNKLLTQAAQAHADFIAEHFTLYSEQGVSLYVEPAGSEGSTGETPMDRMVSAGYTGIYSAELIAFKHTPTAAVYSWMETLYQRLRLLDPNVSEMGLGWSETSGYTIHIVEIGHHE